MSQTANQVMVDAGQRIHPLRQRMDARQHLTGKDVTFFYRNRHDNVVRAAKSVFDLVVQLNVRMLLRQ